MGGATSAPEPFVVDVAQADLDDLDRRLAQVRWADDWANPDWGFGVPGGYLHELVDHWRHRYDWREHERAMNRLTHWRCTIDGVPVHYVRQPGVGPDPMPLVLTHGWPWTFWDYRHVVGPLTDPGAHGGDPADAFELILPSLPGYVFSSPLTTPGVGILRTAELWDRLAHDVLGFGRYGVGGGDSGAFVSSRLAHAHADHVIGCHLTFPALLDLGVYSDLTPEDYAPGEEGWYDQTQVGRAAGAAHMGVHIADPQTLAWALTDSPVGLAAWMLERRRSWSDCGGDVETRFTKDELITSFSLYWHTRSFASSVRFYAESFREPWPPAHDRQPAIEAPTGVAVFPKELALVPRALMERSANLTHWTVMPTGGHFAPAEEPGLVVDDLRAFFRPLRA